MSIGSNANVVTNAAVGITAVQLLAGRTQRDEMLIQNTGAANSVFVGKDSTVTATGATTGIKLATGSNPIRFDDYNGPVWVIADVASAQVTAFEVF
jgi:pyruvate-formate lyase